MGISYMLLTTSYLHCFYKLVTQKQDATFKHVAIFAGYYPAIYNKLPGESVTFFQRIHCVIR